MKNLFLYLLFTSGLLLQSCSKQLNGGAATITQTNISFVYENGLPIDAGACINPTSNYAIAISAKISGTPTSGGLGVKYSFNGVENEVFFTSNSTQVKKVTLAKGQNIAQLTISKKEATLYMAIQEFEIVN